MPILRPQGARALLGSAGVAGWRGFDIIISDRSLQGSSTADLRAAVTAIDPHPTSRV